MKIKSLKTGAYPLIVHAPAWTISQYYPDRKFHSEVNPLWRPILDKWQKSKIDNVNHGQFNELTIITWNNSPEKGLVEKALDLFGVPYTCLGKGVTHWKNSYKINLTAKIIDSIQTPYVMGLDSYDILILRNPLESVEKFKTMNCDLLFNGERLFYPD